MATSNRPCTDSGFYDLDETENKTQSPQSEKPSKTSRMRRSLRKIWTSPSMFQLFKRLVKKDTRDINEDNELEESISGGEECISYSPKLSQKSPQFEDSTMNRKTIIKQTESLPLTKQSFRTFTSNSMEEGTESVTESDASTVDNIGGFIPAFPGVSGTNETNVQFGKRRKYTRKGPEARPKANLEIKRLKEREYKNLQILPYCHDISFENLAEYRLPSSHLLDAYVNDKQKMGMEFEKVIMEIGCNTDSLWLVRIGVRFLSRGSEEWLASFLSDCSDELKQCLVDEVTKLFSRRYEQSLHICEMWVGYSTRCDVTNNPFDTLVVTTYDPIPQTSKVLEFCGLTVVYREKNKFSSEAVALLQHETRHYLTIKLSDIATDDLLSKHSNITLLTISGIKSRGFSGSKHLITVTPCVVVYCKVKGIVPFGEPIFPETIAGYPVDVREGTCSFASNPAGLQLGQKIGPLRTLFAFGTLGGFVDLPESNTTGFITCAHVVCSHDILQRGNVQTYIQNNRIEISDKSIDSTESIGVVRKAVFRYGQDTQVSIDAALVEITSRNPTDGEFAIDWSKDREKLSDMGFSDTNKPSFFNGETTAISSENIRNVFLKVGAATALTLGRVKCKDCDAIFVHKDVEFSNKSFRFFGQREVMPSFRSADEPLPNFLSHGDSGAFVYSIENNTPLVLKCVGMAIAVTSYGSCLMTPIDSVLAALGLPNNCLLKFSNHAVLDTTNRREMESEVLKLLQNMNQRLTSIEQNISDSAELAGRVSRVERILDVEKTWYNTLCSIS